MQKQYLIHQDFFESVFNDVAGCILFHKSGITVHLEQERVTDLGTLPKACHEVPKYFPIEEGQIIVLNDPYCGGGILSNFTLLMGVNLNSGNKKKDAEFLLGKKFSVRPFLKYTENLEEEGLKIPPTPIYEKNVGLNTAILDAISNHPLVMDGFRHHLEKNITLIQELEEHLKESQKLWAIDLDQKSLESYINQSHHRMSEFLTKIKPEKAHYKEQWVTGESLKLELEKQEHKLSFNFTEVSDSKIYHLTKAASFGACFAAVMNLLEQKIPINTGSLECIDIKVPKDTFLDCKYPAPVFLGFTEASGLIANFVSKVLAKINKEFQSAEGNIGCCSVDLKFESGPHFYDRLPSGAGATRTVDGAMIVDKWTHHELQVSIEEVEKRFPMKIRSTSIRPGSGGNGAHTGGEGMIRSYEIKEAAELNWFTNLTGHSADGFYGGNSGLSPQFLVVRGNKKEKLKAYGSMKLEAGDRLDVLTAGGGGFGE